jgi:hypothetical protein
MIHRGIVLLICAALAAQAVEERPARKGGSRQPVQASTCNDVPAHPFDLILGRPTSNAITVGVLCYADAEGCIAYGTARGSLSVQTPVRSFKSGEPVLVVLSALQPNTQYFYQFCSSRTNSAELAFHTARLPGSAFTFTLTADSHLDEHTDPLIYRRMLANARADAPDFHLDLGDTFMTEKHPNREAAAKQYLAQRYYFGQLCESAPLFLALGNHDGECPREHGAEADGLAVWSNLMRKRYFLNPVPDAFYTGDAMQYPGAGLLQDYYAWEWGEALFVVLDPFWFTKRQRGQDGNWQRTLGGEQYQWLKRTLERSSARLKFIFIHHLVGGLDSQGRGGAEAAPFYEWGGRNADGSDGFRQNRPGWPMPTHQLLLQNHVSIVFHGHDHLYAKQDLDGIVYQEVPQPGDPRGNTRSATQYGYQGGTILGSSGHLRALVSASQVKVDYVHTDRSVAHSYSIP